jgi:transcriptional regulator with XRE-family HTH domain
LPFTRVQLKCARPKDYCENPQTIGEHVRRRRIQLGLTQFKLAKRLGVSTETILNWEKRKKTPLITQLGGIIDFLGYYPFAEPTSVCERLLKTRRTKGWSIEEAARHLGVDPTAWGNWERGELILFRRHRTSVAEFIGTALLLLLVFAIIDEFNMPPVANMAPLMIGLVVVAIGMSFGAMHGYAINPARDFGPRLFTVLAGFRNNGITDGDRVWWVPIVAPLVGGVIGAAVYDFGIRRFLPRSS